MPTNKDMAKLMKWNKKLKLCNLQTHLLNKYKLTLILIYGSRKFTKIKKLPKVQIS